jgi:hypothetical protein
MYKTKYKSLDINALLIEIRRLKSYKYYDEFKSDKLAFLAKEILIKA